MLADSRAQTVVLFDFDGVLVAGDSFASVLRGLIIERWWRRVLALAVAPLALPLLLSDRGKSAGAAIYMRIALLGTEADAFEARVRDFAQALARNPSRVHAEAVAALGAHLDQGDRVLVVSGSEQRLVDQVLAALGIRGAEVVASLPGARTRPLAGPTPLLRRAQGRGVAVDGPRDVGRCLHRLPGGPADAGRRAPRRARQRGHHDAGTGDAAPGSRAGTAALALIRTRPVA